MSAHVSMKASDALELFNVFVRRDFMRSKGIGRSLLSAVYEEATAAGASRLLVNSGPRYLASWGFYDRMFDEDRGMLIDYYGTGDTQRFGARCSRNTEYEGPQSASSSR